MAEWNGERLGMFTEGVRLCFSRWTGLQLAVDNQWGGRSSAQKAQQLAEDVVAFMTQSRATRYIDEVEDMLDDNLMEKFCVELDDGSIEEVAETVMYLHQECSAGNFERVQRLATPATPATGATQSVHEKQEGNDSSDDDDEEEEDDAAPEAMNIDESAPAAAQAQAQVPPPVNNANTQGLSETEIADGWQVVIKGKGRRPK